MLLACCNWSRITQIHTFSWMKLTFLRNRLHQKSWVRYLKSYPLTATCGWHARATDHHIGKISTSKVKHIQNYKHINYQLGYVQALRVILLSALSLCLSVYLSHSTSQSAFIFLSLPPPWLYLFISLSHSLTLSPPPSISLLRLSFLISLSFSLSSDKKILTAEGAAHFLLDIDFSIER